MPLEEYKVLAEIYDILNPKEDILAQKDFFSGLIAEHSILKVLDCACGTGLHLSMFFDCGLACFGSDLSPEMLTMAKLNLEGKYIPLKIQDFRNLGESWGDTFDMVTCLTTSLPHMLTDEDAVAALMSMYERVSDGGVLVISNGITDSLLDTKPKFIPARVNENDAFYFICEYEGEKTLTFNILYVKKGAEFMEHVFTSTTYNQMRKSTLERCFANTPFKNIQYYGDFDKSDYTQTSSKLIVVAQR